MLFIIRFNVNRQLLSQYNRIVPKMVGYWKKFPEIKKVRWYGRLIGGNQTRMIIFDVKGQTNLAFLDKMSTEPEFQEIYSMFRDTITDFETEAFHELPIA